MVKKLTEENKKEMKITIDTGNIQAVLKRMTEIEYKNENLTKQLEAQNSVISVKERENEDLKKKLGYSGGSVSMSKAQSDQETINQTQNNGEKVFEGNSMAECQEKMVSWCKENDKASYDKLMNQSIDALANSKQSFEWHDTFDKDGRSIIGRTLDRHNEQLRKKMGYKKE